MCYDTLLMLEHYAVSVYVFLWTI